MNGTRRRGAVLLAVLTGLAAGTAAAQSPDAPPAGFRLTAGGGLGFGTGGVHAGTGDSKPGGTLLGRIGVAKAGRPFLVVDGEWQLYQAPVPDVKAKFDGFSALAGIAVFPTGDFYLMPQVGAQFRNWDGEESEGYSSTGFSAGLNLGYFLSFGPTFSVSPELVLRYADVSGPDTPSFRAIGFRVMAAWVF